ncbi:UNVERIFIED_ORG: hypothetical protein J2W19_003188 [Shinella zoogloeoides]|nr:hypothetical protein [Shinella zoogloeoides]
MYLLFITPTHREHEEQAMSHWVEYLPEVGRPMLKRGEELHEMAEEIGRLTRELIAAEDRHKKAKAALEADVRQFWSAQEVIDAEAAWSKSFRSSDLRKPTIPA